MSKPSKVIFGNQVLMDLTQDTVDASHLLSGYTAHGADGELVNAPCTYDSDTTDADALAAEILVNKTAYVNGLKITGTMPNRGAVAGTISDLSTPYTIANGFHDGSGTVAVDSVEAAKLIPENIREDVTILGVTGTMSGSEDVHAQAVTATPYTTAQTIVPDSSQGYNYISQVTVNAIAYTETANSAGGITIQIGTVAPTV